MNRRLLVKLGSLAVLAVLSSTTSSLLLGIFASNDREVDAGVISTDAKPLVAALPPQPPWPGAVTGPAEELAVATFSLKNAAVEMVNEEVVVHAEVSIMDKRPGLVYVWGLRVGDRTTGHNVLNHVYKDQVFFLNGNATKINPTFDEILDLPPGEYLVGLKLFAVPADYPISRLQEEDQANSWDAVSFARKISVSL